MTYDPTRELEDMAKVYARYWHDIHADNLRAFTRDTYADTTWPAFKVEAAAFLAASHAHRLLPALQAENERLREALWFYANEWRKNADGDLTVPHLTRTWREPTDALWDDTGRKATEALRADEQPKGADHD